MSRVLSRDNECHSGNYAYINHLINEAPRENHLGVLEKSENFDISRVYLVA